MHHHHHKLQHDRRRRWSTTTTTTSSPRHNPVLYQNRRPLQQNISTILSCMMTACSLFHIVILCIQLGSLRAFPSSVLHTFKNSLIRKSSPWKQKTLLSLLHLSFLNSKRRRNEVIILDAFSIYKRFIRLPFCTSRQYLPLHAELQSSDLSLSSSVVESINSSLDIQIRTVMKSRQSIRSLQSDALPALRQYLYTLSTTSIPEPKIDIACSSLYRTMGNTTTSSTVNDIVTNDTKNQYNNNSTTTITSSTPNLQVALVRIGIIWSQQQQQQQQQQQLQLELDDKLLSTSHDGEGFPESSIHVTSAYNRVPGCISTVQVQTIICHHQSHENNDDTTTTIQSICGTTDSYMSRGLLACLSNLFINVTVEEILTLDIPHLINQLSFATVLSQGRNDGFTNMIRVIQSQVSDCVLRLQSQYSTVNVPSPVAFTSKPTPVLLANPVPKSSLSSSPIVKTKTRVALLLSGGVDSSVALNLLVRNNEVQYDVTAFYLKIWLEDELSDLNVCPWEEDVQYCQAVCQQLNVPLEMISLQEQYNDHILSYTINEAKNGRTPNPDILCNRRIKFGCFYDVVMNRKFDYIATGHYAQVVHNKTAKDGIVRAHLHRAPDPVKDQSYFLCALTQEQLQRVIFPIGHLSKVEVRQYADQYDLPNRYRPDSQGLCFLGKVKFDTFLNTYIADRPGPIIDATNNVLVGYHRGLWYHTIGQRKGLGKVLFPNATSNGPWYVVGKNINTNTIYCTNQYDQDVFTQTRSEFAVEAIHWIAGTPPRSSLLLSQPGDERIDKSLLNWSDANDRLLPIFDLKMKIRHGPNLVQGFLTVHEDECTYGNSNERKQGYIYLQHSKDSGLAPGQYVSFYDIHSAECYGCAVISENNWEGETQSTQITQDKCTTGS